MKLISEALVKAQSQFKPVTKDAENPFFKSNYANLSSILSMVMPVLTSNGLAISQPMRVEGNQTILITKLIHSSGESMISEMILPHNADPQKQGSLITYYKRYQLQAMLGISTADEDDDANLISQPQKTQREPSDYVAGRPSEQQQKAIAAIARKHNIDKPDIKTFQEAKDWISMMNSK